MIKMEAFALCTRLKFLLNRTARRHGLVAAALLLCAAVSAHAQTSATAEPRRLSPNDAVQMAIRNNLSLENARLDLDTKKRKSDLVWNQFLPSISMTGTLGTSNKASTQSGIAAVTEMPLNPFLDPYGVFLPAGTPDIYGVIPYSVTLPRWFLNGTLTATLDFSFALISGIQSIQSDYQAGLATYEKARLQVERDIRKYYNQILLLEENVGLLKINHENALRQASTAEANYRAGLVPRLTWLQAQVSVENMKPTISDLENNLKALKATFAMTLGLPYDTVFELEPLANDNFHVPMDLADLISRAVSGRPDIVELRRTIVMLQHSREAMALQLYTPFLRFGWTLSRTLAGDPWKDSWFKWDNWMTGGNFSITLGYSLNTLFPFTKEGQGLRDMDNRLTGLNITLAQAIRGTELEIFNRFNSLERNLTSREVQDAAVELAELTYRLTEEAYRAGLQDFQALENSRLALSQARLALLTLQFNYLNDLIDLEYSLGIPFGTLSNNRGI